MQKYADNQWGFDVHTTVPFLAFRALREIAVENVGEANVLDLSQGEPGYGFAPTVRSRELYAFLLLLDTEFNNNVTNIHFAEYSRESLPHILSSIQRVAQENYTSKKAKGILRSFDIFLDELEKISQNQNLGFGRFEILYDIFKFSIPSGGRYPNPWGEPVVRAAVAEEYVDMLKLPVNSEDLMLLSGASHGIGSVFKGLGEEGIGYLQSGDTVVMTSPVYAPYNNLLEERGINILSLSVDPMTGAVFQKSLETLQSFSGRIKAMVLINPNNPTGFPYGRDLLQVITDLAEKHNALIISDEVYLQFFDDAQSIFSIPEAQKRTIHISSLSKIERATGVRFGAFCILPEGREYISQKILKNHLQNYRGDIVWLLYLAKSPGGKNIGVFQHITGIPGPSQILGLCHLILGKEERMQYVQDVQKKVQIFYETLGLKFKGNSYYGMFDMTELENDEKNKLPVEQKFGEIAERGVVLMPANLFFSQSDRDEKNRTSVVRVSLPNLSFENTKKAAEIIKNYLQN